MLYKEADMHKFSIASKTFSLRVLIVTSLDGLTERKGQEKKREIIIWGRRTRSVMFVYMAAKIVNNERLARAMSDIFWHWGVMYM